MLLFPSLSSNPCWSREENPGGLASGEQPSGAGSRVPVWIETKEEWRADLKKDCRVIWTAPLRAKEIEANTRRKCLLGYFKGEVFKTGALENSPQINAKISLGSIDSCHSNPHLFPIERVER